MKTKTFLVISALAAALQFAPSGFAQAPDANGSGRHWRRHQMLANLTKEERMQLRAAHQKAMADPAVLAAKDRAGQSRKDFRAMKRAAMLRADPTLQPILDKIPARAGKGNS